MKARFLAVLLAASFLSCPIASLAQPVNAMQVPLALSFDLDGEAADADQVVASATLADSTAYTLAADPDVCRLVDVTITDTDSSITAGVLTVTGTDCWDYPLVATFTFAAGGSGVKTLTPTSAARASAAYFKTITDVSNALLTGEGVGDALTVGYTGNSATGWPLYGRADSTPSGRRRVDVFGSYPVSIPVKNGAAQTDVTTVTASAGPFQNVSLGDLLIFNVSGELFYRKVTTRTDANNVVVNAAVPLPAAGTQFSYKKLYLSTDPQDGWIPVVGFDGVSFVVQVDANANTGGVVSSIECATLAADGVAVPDVIFEEDTATVATGATGTDTTSLDLRLKPHHTHCRAGVKFGTGDDTDTAAEDIDMVVGFRR